MAEIRRSLSSYIVLAVLTAALSIHPIGARPSSNPLL
uniref:Uncharacterized protein n=1 Tax=Arundo donax TaxID=35708 RepID=A0A0A9EQ52_ARUDO